EHGCQVWPLQALGQQMPCLLVEGDGAADGYHPHGLFACRETPAEGRFRKSRSQGMIGQFRRRCRHRLQRFQRTAVKDGPPGLTRLSIDHRTDLRVRENVAPISHWPSLALRLL